MVNIMPSGKTHFKVQLISTPIVCAAWVFSPYSIFLLLGWFLSLFVNPDLDIENPTYSKRKLGFLWLLFWWPYAKLIPHRHWLSHGPIISTFLRLFYIYLGTGMWIWYSGGFRSFFPDLFIGLALGDLLHIVLDWTVSFVRKLLH